MDWATDSQFSRSYKSPPTSHVPSSWTLRLASRSPRKSWMQTYDPPPTAKSEYFDAYAYFFHEMLDEAPAPPPKPTSDSPLVESFDSPKEEGAVVINVDPPADPPADNTIPDTNEDEPIAKPEKSSDWVPAAEHSTLSARGHSRVGSLQNWQLPSAPASLRIHDTRALSRAGSVGASTMARSIGGSSIGRRSLFTNREGAPVTGSTFINGAGTVGPDATPEIDESIHLRVASADAALTPKQQSKILKGERDNSKRLNKIIKEEGKVEKQALTVAISELAGLQKVQKAAVKREKKCQSSHNKALSSFHKFEASLLDMRTKFEAAQAVLNAEADALDTARNNARLTTERMQEKSQEIESLRTMLGVDQREREVKMAELMPKKTGSRWGR
ncbi:hypothetical protein HGRIS_004516 [Hohenbuehelia grisea]|uniref:Uncharacterized protein n=1 Tax=Hohenbuehelia grisea TaxID=104357 RepID=A0ABR3JC39_9AGAR